MDFLKKQKRVLKGFCIFLLIMFVLTLISKAVYSYSLPQVTAEVPQRKSLTHRVEAEGTVAAGRECAVVTFAGLRVETVLVTAGERIDAGVPLFLIDMNDISKKIEEREAAVNELKLRIEALEENEGRADRDQSIRIQRAAEDYERTVFEWQVRVGRAKEELEKAEKRLKDYEKHHDEEDDPAEYEALQDAVKAAEQALQNAEWDAASARLEAERKIEDAKLPEVADSSLEADRMKLEILTDELCDVRRIADNGGAVLSGEAGIITRVNVSPGERTPDGAAILYADTGAPLIFKALLTKEEKKHVGACDAVKLGFGRYSQWEHAIDYIAESGTSPGMYEAMITLDESEADIGESGTLAAEAKSEPYRCCVPARALHTDSAARRYVYVAEKRSGILGEELAARAVYVKVLDENDSFAAIEESSIDSGTEIIISSTKELKDGAVVRRFSPE